MDVVMDAAEIADSLDALANDNLAALRHLTSMDQMDMVSRICVVSDALVRRFPELEEETADLFAKYFVLANGFAELFDECRSDLLDLIQQYEADEPQPIAEA